MDKANRFLIDVNLPYYFSIWNSPEFLHLRVLVKIGKMSRYGTMQKQRI